MRWIADAAYLLVGLLYLPVALYQALIIGKNRRGWRQRFGASPRLDPARRRIWIHAVSLGEINATPKLVAALQERLPDVDIVLSTTTDTGYARGVQLYGADRVFRFPLDFSVVVARALRRIRPSLIVLMELEVWYNLTRMATRCGIPVVVVNGRMTERSARRLAQLSPFTRPMFSDLAWVGAQDEAIATRFREAGVAPDRVELTSSLKWDTAAVADHVEGADELSQAMGIDRSRPLWVCGSTGDGEEELILEAYDTLGRNWSDPSHDRIRAATGRERMSSEDRVAFAPRSDRAVPLLAVVPRKPERFDEVARLIESRGFTCIRRSASPLNKEGLRAVSAPEFAAGESGISASPLNKGGPRGVILGDTMGELRKFYCLADVVFVGRSLVPMGGSDPMEVAALAKPVIAGPHMENFDSPVRALREVGAIRIVDSSPSLAGAVRDLLANPAPAGDMGAKARQVVLRNQGATARTADRLAHLLASR